MNHFGHDAPRQASGARSISGRLRAAAAAGLLLIATPTGAETLTIAVVRDGPGQSVAMVDKVRDEVAKHLPHGTEAMLREDPAFDAGWDPEAVAGALGAALADPDVDMILVTGALATVAAAGDDVDLGKPVVSAAP